MKWLDRLYSKPRKTTASPTPESAVSNSHQKLRRVRPLQWQSDDGYSISIRGNWRESIYTYVADGRALELWSEEYTADDGTTYLCFQFSGTPCWVAPHSSEAIPLEKRQQIEARVIEVARLEGRAAEIQWEPASAFAAGDPLTVELGSRCFLRKLSETTLQYQSGEYSINIPMTLDALISPGNTICRIRPNDLTHWQAPPQLAPISDAERKNLVAGLMIGLPKLGFDSYIFEK